MVFNSAGKGIEKKCLRQEAVKNKFITFRIKVVLVERGVRFLIQKA
jgi:hypothetical protein